MERDDFEEKIREGAKKLKLLCSTGDPSEEQMKTATLSAGLPVTFESDSFVIDPVRFAVFVSAYDPWPKSTRTIKRAVEQSWTWFNKQRPAV